MNEGLKSPPVTSDGHVSFWVPGFPQAQGSMKHIGGGRIVHAHSKELMAWRDTIAWYAKAARVPFLESGAVAIELDFILARPKSVKREFPTFPPDGDKLLRSCGDALTGIAYRDDAQICSIKVTKRYGENVGVSISIWSLTCS
jgi:crossover junction endodeoxyribonuclease RusA